MGKERKVQAGRHKAGKIGGQGKTGRKIGYAHAQGLCLAGCRHGRESVLAIRGGNRQAGSL